MVLADDVFVELFLNLPRLGHLVACHFGTAKFSAVLRDYIMAKVHAVRADINLVRSFDKSVGLGRGPPAKTANRLGFTRI